MNLLLSALIFTLSLLSPLQVNAQGVGNGDVNSDGVVDFADIKLLLSSIFGPATTNLDQYADSSINSMDAGVVLSTQNSVIITPTSSPSDIVLAAAGDAVCGTADIGTGYPCKDKETAQVISQMAPKYLLALGDLQYESGSLSDFNKYYNNPLSWSQHKAITKPVPGNHEYGTSGASGYFQYFGALAGVAGKGYYSFDVGTWHIIAINSNCNFSTFNNAHGCDVGSPQEVWLKADLIAHPNKCTLAFMHHPYFTSGQKDMPALKPLIQDLYDYNADLILAGHKHMYEQFAPQNVAGTGDLARGIREIVIGTGGRDLTGVGSITYPNLEIRNGKTFGALKLTLHSTSYNWEFKPIAGQTFTALGSGVCH